MPLLDELLTERRSIRKYKADMPPDVWLEQILRPALLAPSSGNSQPVRFFRISSPELKNRLREAMEDGRRRFLKEAETAAKPKKLRNWINAYYRYSAFMFSAPLLLAAGTVDDQPGFSRRLSEAGLLIPSARGQADTDMAVGLVLAGLLLKAQELGLGSCILSAPLVFISSVEEILALKDVKIKCFITLGFPAEKPAAPPKKGLADLYREL
jgi:nitroreductase